MRNRNNIKTKVYHALVILLRNFNQSMRLYNDIQLIASRMGDKAIKNKVMFGSKVEEIVLVLKSDLSLPIFKIYNLEEDNSI